MRIIIDLDGVICPVKKPGEAYADLPALPDEIYFGKPNGYVYIDDRALRFERWEGLTLDPLGTVAKER